MKNVLIINAHQKYEGIAEGNLTRIFINKADEFLATHNFNVKYTTIDNGYNVQEELDKFTWANTIIFQYPVYWMGIPWLAKKYVDEVFSAGYQSVTYQNDGRSSKDASKVYGSGGLMKTKNYMLSMTYNCPSSEFNNKDGFFNGLSLDEANVAMHKTFEFCGLKRLKSYAAHDIFKSDLDITKEINTFNIILKQNFLQG